MSLEIMTDPRIRGVRWRDLATVSRWESVRELILSSPWLAGSLYFAHLGTLGWIFYLPALVCSFVFFLAALRQVHNGYHRALGISRRATDWFLFAMSVVMLGSLHAIKFNHLQHHRHCLDEHDIEGSSASMSAWKALCYGPLFTMRLHVNALKNAPRPLQYWIRAELVMNALWILCVVRYFEHPALLYHVVVMLSAHCFTAFFAVWTVHHDCDRAHYIARTIRNRVQAWLTFEMFYHVEHHLFPAVPTCHLPQLAIRLDKVAPELQRAQVFQRACSDAQSRAQQY